MVNRRYSAVISVGILSTTLVAASAVGSWAASSGSNAGQRVSALAFCWSTGGKVSLTPMVNPCPDGARKYILRGDQGFTGAVGAPGVKGDMGPRGAVGATGDVGVVGPQGEVGATGDVGPVGPAGATGDIGPKGDPGDVGATGYVGPKGNQGDVGPKGEKGDAGALGATGDTGPKGDTGATGATGAAGPAGNYAFVTTGEYTGTAGADSDLTLTATCTNSTDLAMSAEWDIAGSNVEVMKNRRLTTDSWSVTFHNNANKAADISIWAMCLSPIVP